MAFAFGSGPSDVALPLMRTAIVGTACVCVTWERSRTSCRSKILKARDSMAGFVAVPEAGVVDHPPARRFSTAKSRYALLPTVSKRWLAGLPGELGDGRITQRPRRPHRAPRLPRGLELRVRAIGHRYSRDVELVQVIERGIAGWHVDVQDA